jgi:hypothetical protein
MQLLFSLFTFLFVVNVHGEHFELLILDSLRHVGVISAIMFLIILNIHTHSPGQFIMLNFAFYCFFSLSYYVNYFLF